MENYEMENGVEVTRALTRGSGLGATRRARGQVAHCARVPGKPQRVGTLHSQRKHTQMGTLKTTIAMALKVQSAPEDAGPRETVAFRWSLTTDFDRGRIRTTLTRWMQDDQGFESTQLFRDIRALACQKVARVSERAARAQHDAWRELASQAAEQMGFRPGEHPVHGRTLLWPDEQRGPMLSGADPIVARLALSGVIGNAAPPRYLPAVPSAVAAQG